MKAYVCEKPHNVDSMHFKCLGDSGILRDMKPIPGRTYWVFELRAAEDEIILFDETKYELDRAKDNVIDHSDYIFYLSLNDFYQIPLTFLPLSEGYYKNHKKAYYDRFLKDYFGRYEEHEKLVEQSPFKFNYLNEDYCDINEKILNEVIERHMIEVADAVESLERGEIT